MKQTTRIALISLSSLENMALKDLARDFSHVRTESFGSFQQFLPLGNDFRKYVVAAEEYVAHSDFFLPRQKNTLIVCREKRENGVSASNILYPNSDEAEIEKIFSSFLNDSSRNEGGVEISQRERDVIREVAAGYTNKEIAERLCISVNTVTTHRKNISAKLGIRSSSGLSLYAMLNGLI